MKVNANDVKAQYQLTPEQEEIISQFERFGREELLPLQEKMDLEDWWPEDLFTRFAAIGGLGTTISPESSEPMSIRRAARRISTASRPSCCRCRWPTSTTASASAAISRKRWASSRIPCRSATPCRSSRFSRARFPLLSTV